MDVEHLLLIGQRLGLELVLAGLALWLLFRVARSVMTWSQAMRRAGSRGDGAAVEGADQSRRPCFPFWACVLQVVAAVLLLSAASIVNTWTPKTAPAVGAVNDRIQRQIEREAERESVARPVVKVAPDYADDARERAESVDSIIEEFKTLEPAD